MFIKHYLIGEAYDQGPGGRIRTSDPRFHSNSIIDERVRHAVGNLLKDINITALWSISFYSHLGIQGTTMNESAHSLLSKYKPAFQTRASYDTLNMFIGVIYYHHNVRYQHLCTDFPRLTIIGFLMLSIQQITDLGLQFMIGYIRSKFSFPLLFILILSLKLTNQQQS